MLFDPKVLISYYLLFHMLFLMLCVLPTGFICHTVTAFHDKVTNCIRTKESVCLTVFFFYSRRDSTLSSIVTYLWYLRNTNCKTSECLEISCKRAEEHIATETDSEIALSYARKRKSIQRRHATSM